MGKPYLFSLGGSQEEHKMLNTALKMHLKGFKTQIWGAKLDLVVQVFGSVFGSTWGPKWSPKSEHEGDIPVDSEKASTKTQTCSRKT